MREILELCIDLDSAAETTYVSLSSNCADAELAHVFAIMSKEEGHHVGWWTELLKAWEDGLVPDIVDEADLLGRLRELGDEVSAAIPDDMSRLSADEMLDLAAHLEFYLLDPVFGELLNVTGPGAAGVHNEAYARHVMRLIDAIEQRYSRYDLAHFLARVLRRSFRDQQRLAELATHDQLTGLLNRRGLYASAKQWTSWAVRYAHPLSAVLVDVDRFKTINDTYGHPAGDEALVAIGEALSRAVRSSDIVGRYGGDEFLVIAPETDAEELRLLMQRMLETVRETVVAVAAEPLTLSVSVGGSWTQGGINVSAEQLLAAADRSLYAAKASGRDCAGEPEHAAAQP